MQSAPNPPVWREQWAGLAFDFRAERRFAADLALPRERDPRGGIQLSVVMLCAAMASLTLSSILFGGRTKVSARKEQIRELLMSARARIDPHRFGVRRAGRARSQGLRREEVAVLADVSVKWYTWLEQGRDKNFSDDVVGRVAAALKLSATEKKYLSALIKKRSATPTEHESSVTEQLWRTLQFVPVPAMLMTRRWDILAWNPLIARIYRDYAAVPRTERNLLRIILTDEQYQVDRAAYERIARKLLREFRVDFAQFADAGFEELITELKQIAPDFERLWKTIEICDSTRGTSVVQHSALGELSFDRVSYVPESNNFLRVLMFTPIDAKTARVVASICPKPSECFTPDVAIARRDLEADVVRHTNRHDGLDEGFADVVRAAPTIDPIMAAPH
jgi:transcriptional regulator with XRE-family HTH domain